MTQHKFCLDKQKSNNIKPFLVYVVVIEEIKNVIAAIEKYYECGMNLEHACSIHVCNLIDKAFSCI